MAHAKAAGILAHNFSFRWSIKIHSFGENFKCQNCLNQNFHRENLWILERGFCILKLLDSENDSSVNTLNPSLSKEKIDETKENAFHGAASVGRFCLCANSKHGRGYCHDSCRHR